MSFMDFTMYPNGGFMMCESISEFDPNTPNTPGEEAIAAAPRPTVRDAIANLDDNICIQRVLDALKVVWDVDIMPLVNMELSGSSLEAAVEKADLIGDHMTHMVDILRKIIFKVRTMESLVSSPEYSKFLYQDIIENSGLIIKKMPEIKRLGLDHVGYTYTFHPAFDQYNVNRVVSTILNSHYPMCDEVFDVAMFDQLAGCDRCYSTLFVSIMDMFDVMFRDVERRAHQEVTYNSELNLDDIIKYRLNDQGPTIVDAASNGDSLWCTIMQMMSHRLRKGKQHLYDMQVSLSEKDPEDQMPTDQVIKCLSKAIVSTVNMYIIVAMKLISDTYAFGRVMPIKNTIHSLVDMIKSKVR